MALSPIRFATGREADLRMDYAVAECEAMSFVVLSYRRMDARGIHAGKSFHYDWSTLGGGRTRAADVNMDGSGTSYEVAMLSRYVLPLAQSQGLSIVAGLNGFVAGHSGGMTHAHLDPGSLSNIGGGQFTTPWAGRPTAARTGPSIQRLELSAWKAIQAALGVTPDALPGPATGKALQAALNKKGAGLTVDGAVGALTWKAVQKALGGLVIDGVPGRLTYAALAARPERITK